MTEINPWIHFYERNKVVTLFLLVVIIGFLGYLVYHKWQIKISGIELTPPPANQVVLIDSTTKKEVKATSKVLPQRSPQERAPEKRVDQAAIQHSKEKYFHGAVFDPSLKPIQGAMVKCKNCQESDRVVTNEHGEFRLVYTIETSKQVAELQVTVNNQSITISPSVTQSEIDDIIFNQ